MATADRSSTRSPSWKRASINGWTNGDASYVTTSMVASTRFTSGSTAWATLKADVALLKLTVGRLEARQDRETSDRQHLRDEVSDVRRRLGELEERVQEIEGRLPHD